MKRRLMWAAVCAIGFGCVSGRGASAQAAPVFDVVSIRPHNSGDAQMGMSFRDGTMTSNLFLKSLITSAYGPREGLIFGLPEWAERTRYDIRAKVVDADPAAFNRMSKQQRRALMASLLSERFQLRVHTETRVLPVYELVIDKDVPKFSVSQSEPAPSGTPAKIEFGAHRFRATAVTMLAVVSILEETVDRPVVDKTGLTGRYDVALHWAPEEAPAGDSGDTAPQLFTAVREQLGLRLRPAKGPVQVVVVDHIEQPTPN